MHTLMQLVNPSVERLLLDGNGAKTGWPRTRQKNPGPKTVFARNQKSRIFLSQTETEIEFFVTNSERTMLGASVTVTY